MVIDTIIAMPTVSLIDQNAPIGDTVVVIGVVQAADGPALASGARAVDKALGGRLLTALRAAGVTGKADETAKIPTLGLAPFPLVVAVGLGSAPITDEQTRRAAGAALRTIGESPRVLLALGPAVGPAIEGALLGAYRFDEYKTAPTQPALRRLSVATPDPKDKSARADLRRAQVVAESVALARDLVNTPPNDLYPDALATRAAAVGSAAGLDVEVLDERALKRGGYGGLLAVGGGSVRPPRLVRLTYCPARARAKVALVGKGITFDSGGLNLKPGASMAWMKSDMGGAAAMLAAVSAAATLRLPIEVTATLPMAENMPSGTSYRPSDIIKMRNGSTLEIADTDAEGRIILADAVSRAIEDDPAYLLEASTLTGGQLVALGTRVIGAMGEPVLRDLVVAAGNRVGEAAWAMPLPDDLKSGLDSPVADRVNLPGDRWASMLMGGMFIQDFVPAELAWVHLDIAGPSWNSGRAFGYTAPGGTGAGVRLVLAAIEELAAQQS
jgi:leucyl aminopeptidase